MGKASFLKSLPFNITMRILFLLLIALFPLNAFSETDLPQTAEANDGSAEAGDPNPALPEAPAAPDESPEAANRPESPAPDGSEAAETCKPSDGSKEKISSDSHCKRRTLSEILLFYGSNALTGVDLATYAVSIFNQRAAKHLATSIVGGAIGLGTVALLDNWGDPLRYGLPSAISMGTSVGFLIALPQVLLIPEWTDTPGFSYSVSRGIFLSGLILGGTGGYFLGESRDLSPGQSTAIHLGALWGFGLGALTSASIILPRDWLSDTPIQFTAWSLWTGGAIAGALGGYFLGQAYEPSSKRLWVTTAGGFGGMYVGLLGAAIAVRNGGDLLQSMTTGLGLGALAGLGLTWYLTRDYEPDLPACKSNVSLGVMPAEGGGMLVFGGSF